MLRSGLLARGEEWMPQQSLSFVAMRQERGTEEGTAKN